MTNVRTRLATMDDLAAIQDIVRAAYTPWIDVIGKPPGPMDDNYAERIAAGQVTLHERPEPKGVMVLIPLTDALLIDNIAVLPDAQGTGVGTSLLHRAEKVGRDTGYDLLRLYTHAEMTWNIGLYRALGFRGAGKVREKGFDRVYMERYIGR